MTKQQTIAEMIQQRRQDANMSQAVLAQACGVSERTIIRIESGSRPSSETLMALCSVLKIAPEAARAAMPDAPEPAAETGPSRSMPSFGPMSDSSKATGLRTALSRNPDAAWVACGDVMAGLNSPEGQDWLRQAASVKDFAATSEAALSAEAERRRPRIAKILGAALDWTDRTFGDGLGALAMMVFALLFTGAALAGAVVTLLLASSAGTLPSPFWSNAIMIGLIAGCVFLARHAHRSVNAGQRINDLNTVVIAASPFLIVFARGSDFHDFAADSCKQATLEKTSDGKHATLKIEDRFGVHKTIRWLRAEPGLMAVLERFCAKANAKQALSERAMTEAVPA